MRFASLASLTLTVALALPAAGQAQSGWSLKIRPVNAATSPVRVGLPTGVGGRATEFKTGFWVPIYIDLHYENKSKQPIPLTPRQGEIVIEAVDNDEVENRYTVPWPQMEPGEQRTVIAYIKPGSDKLDTIKVELHSALQGRVIDSHKAKSDSGAIAPSTVLYLLANMGASAPLMDAAKPPNMPAGQRDESCRFAQISRVKDLPEHWFGYSSVDVMVLSTAGDSFLASKGDEPGLLDDNQELRRDALVEWVRRGGKLVIGVGRNHQLVKALLEKMPLLRCTIQGSEKRDLPTSLWNPLQWPGMKHFTNAELALLEPIQPGQGIDVLAQTTAGGKPDRPVVLQSACGLGRVWLVAFDLDQKPFGDWTGQKEFWHKLHNEMNPRSANEIAANQGMLSDNQDLLSRFVDGLEPQDVPVISFGWVALFILLYIIVVGPLDYLFLKLVIKRLELTWITFPAVVLAVSAAAYFAAYTLKGSDLKINKVDIVDIVAEVDGDRKQASAAQMYGTTMFTLFSPRIQNYTLGVEPAEAWAVRSENRENYSVVLSWLGKPENVLGGTGRSASQGFLRRAYDYDKDAAGLKGVPVQVWATKSFTASWQGVARNEKSEPLFLSTIGPTNVMHEPLKGGLTSNLKTPLQDVTLFYRGDWYALGDLKPGDPIDLTPKLREGRAGKLQQEYFRDYWRSDLKGPAPSPRDYRGQVHNPPSTLMKNVFFHKIDPGIPHLYTQSLRNSSLRHLDQSWRLSKEHADEVVLVGRVKPIEGKAAQLDEAGLSPTRLWDGSLPDAKKSWTSHAPLGKIHQETYVRVYIPLVR